MVAKYQLGQLGDRCVFPLTGLERINLANLVQNLFPGSAQPGLYLDKSVRHQTPPNSLDLRHVFGPPMVELVSHAQNLRLLPDSGKLCSPRGLLDDTFGSHVSFCRQPLAQDPSTLKPYTVMLKP